jgi:hypothetical protein
MGSAPQYGEGIIESALDDGVFGSRTGIFTSVAVCVTGSRIGT